MPREILKKCRTEKKMTQAQVASYLGITTRYYQKIEAGCVAAHIEYWDVLEDLFNLPQRKLRVLDSLCQQDSQE